MAAAGGYGSLVPHVRPCAPIKCIEWMVDNPPSKQIKFLGLLRMCFAIKTLQWCGNASSPEQRSALRAIHTLTPPQKIHLQAQRFVAHPFDASARCARPHVGCWGGNFAGGGHGCGGCDAHCVLC
jgi:hypothetical protein